MANETLNETAIRLNEHSSGGSAQSLHGPSGNSSLKDPICMSVVASPMWPNVTNKLQDNDSGDCEAVLGQDCVRALLVQNAFAPDGGCTFPDLSTSACEGVFNAPGERTVVTSRKSPPSKTKQ